MFLFIMSVKIKNINIVYNSNNDNILQYSPNTLLDRILVDLWNDIIKYLDLHPFIVCDKIAYHYPYRPMKKEEFGLYANKFVDYYYKNNRIIHSLKEIALKDSLLAVENQFIISKDPCYYLVCFNNGKYNISFDGIGERIQLSSVGPHDIANNYLTLMIFDKN